MLTLCIPLVLTIVKFGGPLKGKGQRAPLWPNWNCRPSRWRMVLSKNWPFHSWEWFQFGSLAQNKKNEHILIQCSGKFACSAMIHLQQHSSWVKQLLHLIMPSASLHLLQSVDSAESLNPSWQSISSRNKSLYTRNCDIFFCTGKYMLELVLITAVCKEDGSARGFLFNKEI